MCGNERGYKISFLADGAVIRGRMAAPTFFGAIPMVEQAKELLADVARHRADLIRLRADPKITPDRMKKCVGVVDDLEWAIAEILTMPWVPRTIPELTACIASVRMNLRWVDEHVDAVIDDVIECGRMDEYLKLSAAISMGRVLEFQFSVLMDALVNSMKCPCGCGAFVPKGWVN